MKPKWTVEDIPDLHGKVAVVTGSNVGLGLEIATQLAAKGALVYLACRTPSKAETAKNTIIQSHPDATVKVLKLDTSSQESVRGFADNFKQSHDRLDILMCNAGVMALEERKESVDGHELQLATNHLGHFLLTGLLHPLLVATEGSRVVTQSSSGNWTGKFDFEDLDANKSYDRWGQYSMTKLANIAFVNEYNRRVQAKSEEWPQAYSAHPGLVVGQLQTVSAGNSVFYQWLYKIFGLFAGTYQTGAVPALYACTATDVKVGEFFGPDGWFSGLFRGDHPKVVKPNKIAEDKEQICKLWEISEEMTKFKFDV